MEGFMVLLLFVSVWGILCYFFWVLGNFQKRKPRVDYVNSRSNPREIMESFDTIRDVVPPPPPVEEESFANILMDRIGFFREYPRFFDILDEMTEFDSILIKGLVQSGKGAVKCGIAAYNVKTTKITTIVLLRNSIGDNEQFTRNFMDGRFDDWGVPCLYAGDFNADSHQLTQSLNGDNPSVITCIDNYRQLRVLRQILDRIPNAKFDIIIDECDSIRFKNISCKSRKELDMFYDRARVKYNVTATCIDNLLLDKSLYPENVFRLPRPENYKGIGDFTHIVLDEDMNFSLANQLNAINSYSFYDNRLSNIFLDIQARGVFENAIDMGDGYYQNHPNIVINSTSTEMEQHLMTMNVFASHGTRFYGRWCALVYNSSGVYLFHPELDQSFEINGKRGEIVRDDPLLNGLNVLKFKSPKIIIGDVLRCLREKDPEAEIFKNIVIIAGKTEDRGVNNSSNGDFKWHATDMVYRASNKTHAVLLVQQIGRLARCADDDIELRLYCSQNIYDNAINEQKVEMKSLLESISGKTLNETTRNIEFGETDFPTRNLTPNTKKKDFKIKFLLRVWGLQNLMISISNALNSHRETKVIRILRFFLTSEFTSFSKRVIMEACGISNFVDFTKWTRQHGRYKLLVSDGDEWKINPEVLDAIQSITSRLI